MHGRFIYASRVASCQAIDLTAVCYPFAAVPSSRLSAVPIVPFSFAFVSLLCILTLVMRRQVRSDMRSGGTCHMAIVKSGHVIDRRSTPRKEKVKQLKRN